MVFSFVLLCSLLATGLSMPLQGSPPHDALHEAMDDLHSRLAASSLVGNGPNSSPDDVDIRELVRQETFETLTQLGFDANALHPSQPEEPSHVEESQPEEIVGDILGDIFSEPIVNEMMDPDHLPAYQHPEDMDMHMGDAASDPNSMDGDDIVHQGDSWEDLPMDVQQAISNRLMPEEPTALPQDPHQEDLPQDPHPEDRPQDMQPESANFVEEHASGDSVQSSGANDVVASIRNVLNDRLSHVQGQEEQSEVLKQVMMNVLQHLDALQDKAGK
eukprot:scpid98040/ scgid14620/ 